MAYGVQLHHLVVLEIGTIYSVTFTQFLAARSLFGLFMGGAYGNAIAIALENRPNNAQGLISGVLQQGYSIGYIFAECANLGVGRAVESWKAVSWIASGLSMGAGVIRVVLPESKQFTEASKAGKGNVGRHTFWTDTKRLFREE